MTTAPRSLIRWTSLDIHAGLRRQVPTRTEVVTQIAYLDRCELPMVDEFVVRCRRGKSALVQRLIGLQLGPTRCEMIDAFTGEVVGMRVPRKRLYIVGVECYDCRDLLVIVQLDHL